MNNKCLSTCARNTKDEKKADDQLISNFNADAVNKFM